MNPRIDLIGRKSKTLTVVSEAPRRGSNRFWYCECAECGLVVERPTSRITKGRATCDHELLPGTLEHMKRKKAEALRSMTDQELYTRWATKRWV